MVRATVLDDQAAASYLLHDVTNSHLVRKAKVSCRCLLAPSDGKSEKVGPKSYSVSQA